MTAPLPKDERTPYEAYWDGWNDAADARGKIARPELGYAVRMRTTFAFLSGLFAMSALNETVIGTNGDVVFCACVACGFMFAATTNRWLVNT